MSIEETIQLALQEDLGKGGDHTSLATIPTTARGKAKLLVKGKGVIAGIDVAKKVFQVVDSEIVFEQILSDGDKVKYGDIAFLVEGKSISLLSAERLALNFMQRMSGIATYTWSLVKMIEEYGTKILDTRKTTPNLRIIEKQAVKAGGGHNHRMGLYDMMMIKDNHVDFAGGIEKAIESANLYQKQKGLSLKIEIEVRSMQELETVLEYGGVHRIMLDNFDPEILSKAVELIDKRYETEASGGITSDNIVEYAKTGVEYISVGALTHHIKSLDMSLKAVL